MGHSQGTRVQRRLAAIFAGDIVGFSALMSQDEEGTLARIKQLRRDLIEPAVQEHGGRVFKTTGDGFLAEFPSPVEAVRCALKVQEALASNAILEPSRPLQLRIGINLGDIIVEEDGDVYGEGVNVAARLEQLADAGGIWISGSVHDHVDGRIEALFESCGEQQVKNIAKPVRVYALGGQDPAPSPKQSKVSPLSDRPSIAVLPFENMSGDPEQLYFSDGISEDVITELSRFRELMVIARNSSFSFRRQSVDVREIGRSLGAGYVVEGSVRRAGNRVRITAQLVDAITGCHLWAERFDRAVEDVFSIQEEIAQSIVATVAQRVIESSELATRRRPPEDIRAYDLFLQGYRMSDVFTPEVQAKAKAAFEQALKIDPGFARAYTGLAYVYMNRDVDEGFGVAREKDENRVMALRLAEQALPLDPNDPRVHATLGYMCLTWRQFDRAEHHMDLARAMNPNDAMIQITWGWLQACLGRAERGLLAAEIALRLNPRHPTWYNFYLSRILFPLGRFEEVATLLQRRKMEDPARRPRDMAWRAAALGYLGQLNAAQRCSEVFVQSVRSYWRGDPEAGPREYVNWLVDLAFLRRSEDEERLREGLRLAGLPA